MTNNRFSQDSLTLITHHRDSILGPSCPQIVATRTRTHTHTHTHTHTQRSPPVATLKCQLTKPLAGADDIDRRGVRWKRRDIYSGKCTHITVGGLEWDLSCSLPREISCQSTGWIQGGGSEASRSVEGRVCLELGC